MLMHSKPVTATLAVALSMLLGCGQSSQTAAAALDVAVVVSPKDASVLERGSSVFSAAVTGAVDVSVTWYVLEGSAGGSVSGGVYVAPATAGTYHVVARSVASGAEGQAAVVVLPQGPTTGTFTSVFVHDAATTTGQSVQLVADVVVSGTIDKSLAWSVDSGSLGSIDAATGIYTAPATAGRYKVWATSKADPTKKDYGFVDVTAVGGTPGGGGPVRTGVRIGFLHHSTGFNIWNGGVANAFTTYNAANGTNYQITRLYYPLQNGGPAGTYPWANYSYDYWRLWSEGGTGVAASYGERTLEQLTQDYDVVVFKHCFSASVVVAADGNESVSSEVKTLANYKLQYAALKTRLRQFPNKKFLLWTGAMRVVGQNTAANAARYQEFLTWLKGTWDEPGDNIFLWDFATLETGVGGLYMLPEHALGTGDSHPNPTFSAEVAPYLSQRIIDVIEGRGDTGSLIGR
jgi:hypothetical protein